MTALHDYIASVKSYLKQNIVLFVLALSIISAVISPACKFVSGQSTLIEICTAYGVKSIYLSNNDTQKPQQSGHQTNDKCSFCFSAKSQKYLPATYSAAITPIIVLQQIYKAERHTYIQYRYSHYHSTGPPRHI